MQNFCHSHRLVNNESLSARRTDISTKLFVHFSNLQAGGPRYEVETGRRDGRVSNLEHAKNMPEVNDSIETLKSKFSDKGLSNLELVILSGNY